MSPRPPTLGRRRPFMLAGLLVALWIFTAGLASLLRRVTGGSMRPTLEPGDVVVVLPIRGHAERGDVVTLPDPREPERTTIKRVVAVAGDLADLGGEVAAVPRGHLALAGDARTASTDSRRYGAVPTHDLTGRVPARVWPRPRRL